MIFDEERAKRLESNYSRRDFQRRRRLVLEALGAKPPERVLDIGCGPGFYVTELADLVGPQGEIVGVDNSADMINLATERCKGRVNVTLHEAPATSLPVKDSYFDAAISVQVLEFVDDVDGAITEMYRVLRPGGRLVLWDVDWSTVSWFSAEQERMASALRAWDGHLSHPSLPRTLAPRLRSAGFVDVLAEGHAFATTEFSQDSYGVLILPSIADYVSGKDGITKEQAQAWAREQRELGDKGKFFFACLQFCFSAKRA